MSASLFTDHFRKGTHTERDALATASLPKGCKFACSDHGVVDEWTGAAWALWFSPLVDPESVRDTIGAALVAGAGVTITVDDPGDHITISATTDPEVVRDTIAAALRAGAGVTISSDDPGDTITISASGSGYSDEQAQDAIAALLAAGSHTGITFTYDDANNKLSATVTGAGSGGGGSTSPGLVLPADKPPVAANAKDDEFNDAAGMSGPQNGLRGSWTKRNTSANLMLWQPDLYANGLLFIPQDNNNQWLTQTAPAGDFTVRTKMQKIQLPGRQMWGLGVMGADLASGIAILFDQPGGDTPKVRNIGAGMSAGGVLAAYSQSPWGDYWWNQNFPIEMSIKKIGNVYTCRIWFDGTFADGSAAPQMQEFAIDMGSSFVPAHIGIGRGFGSGLGLVGFDYFRVS